MITCSLWLLCEQKEQENMSPTGYSVWVKAYRLGWARGARWFEMAS